MRTYLAFGLAVSLGLVACSDNKSDSKNIGPSGPTSQMPAHISDYKVSSAEALTDAQKEEIHILLKSGPNASIVDLLAPAHENSLDESTREKKIAALKGSDKGLYQLMKSTCKIESDTVGADGEKLDETGQEAKLSTVNSINGDKCEVVMNESLANNTRVVYSNIPSLKKEFAKSQDLKVFENTEITKSQYSENHSQKDFSGKLQQETGVVKILDDSRTYLIWNAPKKNKLGKVYIKKETFIFAKLTDGRIVRMIGKGETLRTLNSTSDPTTDVSSREHYQEVTVDLASMVVIIQKFSTGPETQIYLNGVISSVEEIKDLFGSLSGNILNY